MFGLIFTLTQDVSKFDGIEMSLFVKGCIIVRGKSSFLDLIAFTDCRESLLLIPPNKLPL